MIRERFIKLGMSMGFPKRYMQIQADWVQEWHYAYSEAIKCWFLNKTLFKSDWCNKSWKNYKFYEKWLKSGD